MNFIKTKIYMSEAVIAKSEAQLAEQTQLTNSSNAPTEPLSFSGTIKELSSMWRNSLSVKIVSGSVLAFILLIAFLAFNGNSVTRVHDTKLNDERRRLAARQPSILDLDNQKNTLQANVKSNYGRVQELKESVQKTSQANIELEKKIKQQRIGIIIPKDKEVLVKPQADRLQQKKTEMNDVSAQTQEEIKEVKQRLGDWTNVPDYIKWGFFASMGINVGGAINELSLRPSLHEAQEKTAIEENIGRDLMGRLDNINATRNDLVERIKNLQEGADEIAAGIGSCNEFKKQSLESLDRCRKDTVDLHYKTRNFMDLGLNQAEYQILSYMNRSKYVLKLVYDSRNDGFSREEFLNSMYGYRYGVVVVRTAGGYTFGAVLNVNWKEASDYQEDATAFTFSTINNKICEIKDKTHAARFGEHYLMEIGLGEILIEISDGMTTQGYAKSDITYNCNAPHKDMFYAEADRFTITELLVIAVEDVPTAD